MLEARLEELLKTYKLDDLAVIFVFRAILCMRNSVLWLILALLPIIQHFQDAAN